MEKKFMNKLDDMELDMVAGGRGRGGFEIRRPKDNSKSMAANVDETQNASGWLGSSMVGK